MQVETNTYAYEIKEIELSSQLRAGHCVNWALYTR